MLESVIMKRILLSFPIFVITFTIGHLLLSRFETSPVTVTHLETISEASPQTEVKPGSQINPNDAEYVPEFFELQSDYWYEDYGDDNLVDLFRTSAVYRESEVIAKTGETWLTLFERNGKYSFVRSKAAVQPLRTTSYVGDENEVHLSFDKPGNPIIAVNKLKAMRPGPVSIAYHAPSSAESRIRGLSADEMKDGYKRYLKVGESWYTLRVSYGLAKDGTKVGVLILEYDGVTQVIAQNYHEPGYGSIIGSLYLAGDLDNDGKLDLYFDWFNEKGAWAVTLYLSSAAKPDELIRPVATFSMAGC